MEHLGRFKIISSVRRKTFYLKQEMWQRFFSEQHFQFQSFFENGKSRFLSRNLFKVYLNYYLYSLKNVSFWFRCLHGKRLNSKIREYLSEKLIQSYLQRMRLLRRLYGILLSVSLYSLLLETIHFLFLSKNIK